MFRRAVLVLAGAAFALVAAPLWSSKPDRDCLTIAVRSELPARWDNDVRGVLDDLRGFGFGVTTNGPDPITIALGATSHSDYPGEAFGRTILLNPGTPWKHGWVDEHVPGVPDDRTRIALAKTLAHEIGHALGLPHIEDVGEVMHGGAWADEWGPRTSRALRHIACND